MHPMSASMNTAIGAGAVLAGSGLTGFIASRLAAGERRARRAGELIAALSAYGYALDRLHAEIRQLPQRPGRVATWTNRQLARTPQLDWVLGMSSRRLLGGEAMQALDAFNAAHN